MENIKVLVVDDEMHIIELLQFNLTKRGFDVFTATNGEEAIQLAINEKPDLIVLDVMLPGMDGIDVCRKLRQNVSTSDIPVIMLTARGEESDKILGLEMGADDYLTKPFSPRELVARIKAVLRRTRPEDSNNIIEHADIRMDLSKHEVYVKGEKKELTLKEFELLKILIANPGRVFSRDQLMESIWGYNYIGDSRTVDVHIRHLRQKIEEDSGEKFIETVRGIGYRFKE